MIQVVAMDAAAPTKEPRAAASAVTTVEFMVHSPSETSASCFVRKAIASKDLRIGRDKVGRTQRECQRWRRQRARACRRRARAAGERTTARVWEAITASSSVGITHTDGVHPSWRDASISTLIGVGVDADAQPREALADSLADQRGVLADARGEDEPIQAA